jgi:hypothetical protein
MMAGAVTVVAAGAAAGVEAARGPPEEDEAPTEGVEVPGAI